MKNQQTCTNVARNRIWSKIILVVFLVYMRLQVPILQTLVWAGAVHLAEMEVKFLFPSEVTSQTSGSHFSFYGTGGRSCLSSSAKPETVC